MIVTRAREPANPPDLESGDARGSTEARDHFIEAPVAEQTTGIRLLNGTTQVQFLPGVIAAPAAAMRRALRGISLSACAQSIPLNAQSVRPAC